MKENTQLVRKMEQRDEGRKMRNEGKKDERKKNRNKGTKSGTMVHVLHIFFYISVLLNYYAVEQKDNMINISSIIMFY